MHIIAHGFFVAVLCSEGFCVEAVGLELLASWAALLRPLCMSRSLSVHVYRQARWKLSLSSLVIWDCASDALGFNGCLG